MAGRRPKPTALKISQGNPGKRRLNELEPTPEPGEGVPPKMLSRRARGIWKLMAPMLVKLKVLTEADHPALAFMCLQSAQAEEIALAIAKQGLFVKGVLRDSTGKAIGEIPVINPAFRVQSQAIKEVRGWLLEFGLTPASRSKVTKVVQPSTLKPDPLSELRARAKRSR